MPSLQTWALTRQPHSPESSSLDRCGCCDMEMKWDSSFMSSSPSSLITCSNSDTTVTGSLCHKLSFKILHKDHLSLDYGIGTNLRYLNNPALMPWNLGKHKLKNVWRFRKQRVRKAKSFKSADLISLQVFLLNMLGVTRRVTLELLITPIAVVIPEAIS